jgi:hypothetical protein
MSDYIVGFDIGVGEDVTSYTVIDAESNAMIGFGVFRASCYRVLLESVMHIVSQWQPRHAWIEANNSGFLLYDELMRERIPVMGVTVTAKSKPEMVNSLKAAINTGALKLPQKMDYLNPDENMSLAIAWHGARQYKSEVDFT